MISRNPTSSNTLGLLWTYSGPTLDLLWTYSGPPNWFEPIKLKKIKEIKENQGKSKKIKENQGKSKKNTKIIVRNKYHRKLPNGSPDPWNHGPNGGWKGGWRGERKARA